MNDGLRTTLLYHFCRLQLPALALSAAVFERHLQRAYALFGAKRAHNGASADWNAFLDNLYSVDWFLCCACLEGQSRAWECLFAARASRADCLLVDALRARAVRLFPRDEERQDNAVSEFWGYLLAGEKSGSTPILARYDGQRPLVPWLIRVFQNKHISDLRRHAACKPFPKTISTITTCLWARRAIAAGTRSFAWPRASGLARSAKPICSSWACGCAIV